MSKAEGEVEEARRDDERIDRFAAQFGSARQTLSPAALRVARFLDRNRVTVLASSAADLAQRSGTSDATVIRTIQALGYEGLADLRKEFAATLNTPSTPADDMRRTLRDVGESSGRAIDLVLETHYEALQALRLEPGRRKLAEAVARLDPAERIAVFGIGPSAQLARYVAMLLNRGGRRAVALDAAGIALADQLLDLRAGDALLLLAYGRAYREVVATFQEGRRLGLPMVLVTDTLESRLARYADVVVPARRGRAERVALHGTTLVALEALVLGLAACDRARALATLEQLNDLRAAICGMRNDVGTREPAATKRSEE